MQMPSRGSTSTEKLTWHTFYNVPVVHYSNRIWEQQPRSVQIRWKRCLLAFHKLRAAGIHVNLVPLSYDSDTGSFWMDYVDDYVANEIKNGPQILEEPHVNVVLKIDDDGHLMFTHLYLNHDGIHKQYKAALQQIFKPYPWFAWNGHRSRTMELRLSDVTVSIGQFGT